ncbi:hypothetical protein ILYODFUR_011559 [Ilyodon furcidens]|uniref:Uncharacterized protein n=1 Tax=Ilyodon furcidens TaxID=33524 RepID=A0ABV0U5V5_9TELE
MTLPLISPSLKTRKIPHTERLVGHAESRVKGERKGLFCAFRPFLVLKCSHTDINTSLRTHTHTHTSAHRHQSLLEGGSDLSLCSANQKMLQRVSATSSWWLLWLYKD